jgi:hypothetical protein
LQTLAPFGRGNPPVALMVADATFADVRPMGEGKHARFTVESHGVKARAVAFGSGGRLPLLTGANADADAAQATFALEVNEWNGVSEPRLVLRHVQAADALAEELHADRAHAGGEAAVERHPLVPAAGAAEELVLFAL